MTNPDINIFFRDPRSRPTIPDSFSQLYLLRRDIDTCFAVDADTGNPVVVIDAATGNPVAGPRLVFPGTMAILAGIDLLGKFVAGSDNIGGVKVRFKDFLTQYFKLSNTDADLIYRLRNSLLHSFGLYTKLDNGIIYNFILGFNQPQLVNTISPVDFMVDVNRLYSQFNIAVDDYMTDLNDSSNPNQSQLETNFLAMFSKHRLIRIG